MRTTFVHYTFCMFLLCLLSCAREEDFPNKSKYPYMEILSATSDSTGIQVAANVLQGTATAKEYGFAYKLNTADAENEIKVQVSLTENNLKTVLVDGLTKKNSYQIRAYAVVEGKTVYGPAVLVESMVSSSPVITDFSPKEGSTDTDIIITGASFTKEAYQIEVYIGPVRLYVIAAAYDRLVARMPHSEQFGSYPIRVVYKGKEGASKDSFKILGPEILRMSKYEGLPGDTVTLFGNHFSGRRWGPNVRMNGLAFKVLSASETKVQLEVPFAEQEQFDTPSPLSVTVDNKTAISSLTFTILSNFSQAAAFYQRTHIAYAPAFEADGKGYFFDYNRVLSYSTATGTWREESQFPGVARYLPIWQRIGDKAYLIGGADGNRYYGDVWEYDFRSGIWTKRNSPNFSVKYAASFVLDGKIYFAGGENSQGSYLLRMYDPATQQFASFNNIPGYVEYGRAFTRNGKAYILTDGSVMEYNQASDSWQEDSKFSATDSYALTIGSETYLLPNKQEAVLYHYVPSTKTWEKVAYYPGCNSSNYYFMPRFTGFATNNALYVGTFLSNLNGGCSSFYSYRP